MDHDYLSENVELGYLNIPLLAFVPDYLWPPYHQHKYKHEDLLPLGSSDHYGRSTIWKLNPPRWGDGPGYDVHFSQLHIRLDLYDAPEEFNEADYVQQFWASKDSSKSSEATCPT
eukprot:Platyproteum_vivax@DN5343_c1_g1_i5.p2